MQQILAIYQSRPKVAKKVPVAEATDLFSTASELNDAVERAKSDASRARHRKALMEHLYAHGSSDADCGVLLFQILSDEEGQDFAQLAQLGFNNILLAQRQNNFQAEVSAFYSWARLMLDHEPSCAKALLDVCAIVMNRNCGGMDAESCYDMWCLAARAAEVVVIDGDLSYRQIEIKCYERARKAKIESDDLRGNYFPEARLLVLKIGDRIGTQQTSQEQLQVNAFVQTIVDDLKPLEILRWIDEEGWGAKDKELQLADTVCYIALCMYHGHVENANNIAKTLFERAQRGGADVDKLALWL